MRTSTSERATGRCNNAPFLGCTTAGCPVGQSAASGGCVHGAGTQSTSPSIFKALAAVRTSASRTSERATGRCNNAPFWVYHGRLASGAISDEQRPCARAGTQKHQSQYRQGFCGGCAQAPSRTSERTTGRCNNAPFLVLYHGPFWSQWGNQRSASRARRAFVFLGGAGLFSTTKNGVLFSLASTPCKWDPQLELICSGPRGHPNLALDSAAKSLDVSQSSAYADAPRVRASAKQGHIRWG